MKFRRTVPALLAATAIAAALLTTAGSAQAVSGSAARPSAGAARIAVPASPSGRYIVRVDRTSNGVGSRIAALIRSAPTSSMVCVEAVTVR